MYVQNINKHKVACIFAHTVDTHEKVITHIKNFYTQT